MLVTLFLSIDAYLSISTVDDMGIREHIGKQEKTNSIQVTGRTLSQTWYKGAFHRHCGLL
jgi:hypothetical protein